MATAKKKQEERASELGGDSDNEEDAENLRDSDSSDMRAGDIDMSPPPPTSVSLTSIHASYPPALSSHHLGLP